MPTSEDALERRTLRKISRRLIPFLILCYFISYLDRVNIGFAGPAMRADLGLTATAFGAAAGIFFLAYFLCEVPSNLALHRFGARLWIARIMLTWGLLSGAQAFVTSETGFILVRLLLGAAEAGFFPGVLFYLTLWFPAAHRARIVGLFMFAVPFSAALGSPLSGWILGMHGFWGLQGWQWIFLVEAVPALLLTVGVLRWLPDRPGRARWLTDEERAWLARRLEAEARVAPAGVHLTWRQALLDHRVLGYGLAYFGLVAPLYALSFFQPQVLLAAGPLSDLRLGFLNGFPYLVGALGMVVWAFLAERGGRRLGATVLSCLCVTAGLLLATAGDGLTPLLGALALTSFGIFSALPVFWALSSSEFGTGAVTAAAGIAWINSLGNLGGYLGPQAFGLMHDATGGDAWGLGLMACLPLLSAVLVLRLGRRPQRVGGRP